MFAAANFIDLIAHEFASLGRCGLTRATVATRFLDCAFARHVSSMQPPANDNAVLPAWFREHALGGVLGR
jgi:hypothetical protein